MARRAPWTPSPRPTQGSSSMRPRRCPRSTSRACCSSRALPAARRKVGAQPGPRAASSPEQSPEEVAISRCPEKSGCFMSPAHGLRHLTGLSTLLQPASCLFVDCPPPWSDGPPTLCVPCFSHLVAAATKPLPGALSPKSEGPPPPPRRLLLRRPSHQCSILWAHPAFAGSTSPVMGTLALQLAMVSRLMTKSTLRIDPVFV